MAQANDEMIPLFQKVIEKVEALKKETESKKLMELGQRIAHLQKMVDGTKKQVLSQDSPLRTLEQERVDKYLVMEENIAKAEKNYGKFSQNFHKNQEVFSNINKVYQQIARSHDTGHPHSWFYNFGNLPLKKTFHLLINSIKKSHSLKYWSFPASSFSQTFIPQF